MTTQNALRDEQYKTSKNLHARAELHRFSNAPVKWFDWLFDQLLVLQLPANARIVDVGGGPGWFWKHNFARIPWDWRILHTDFSPGMVEEARSSVRRNGSTFAVADAENLSLPDGSFDAVIAMHMLYHVPDVPRAIQEFARLLEPNGRLFASTLSETAMPELWLLIKAFYGIEDDRRNPFAVHGFTLEDGPAKVATCFGDIRVSTHVNVLEVTEAEPLAAYITSRGNVGEATRSKLLAFLTNKLAEVGTLRIHPRMDLLTATKR